MADVRVTQSANVVIDATDPENRITQVAVLALAIDGYPIRTTQEATLVLASDTYPIRTTQASLVLADKPPSGSSITQAVSLVLATHAPCLTKRCQCWKIVRTDGVVFAFTTHDRPINFLNEIYIPCESLSATASDSAILSGSGASDTTFSGILNDESITEHDMSNGLFDGAKVEVWLVPWDDSQFINDSPKRIAAGVLGKISHGKQSYLSEMLTPGSKLTTRPLLQTYTPACRWELGDGRCPVDLSLLEYQSSVSETLIKSAVTRATYRQFRDSTLVNDNEYSFGSLTWISGSNSGLKSEVKSNESGLVTLWQSMPNEINIGDQYVITPGCDKTRNDHVTKFGLTMLTFGGYPDIPGTDVMVRTPDAK